MLANRVIVKLAVQGEPIHYPLRLYEGIPADVIAHYIQVLIEAALGSACRIIDRRPPQRQVLCLQTNETHGTEAQVDMSGVVASEERALSSKVPR